MKDKMIWLTFLAVVFTLLTQSVFAASPRTNYLLYCSGCHRPLGEGNPPNVPTLRDELGYMMSVEAMRGYLARVPGSAHAPISNAQLTNVLNWMLDEFNAKTLPSDFKKLTVEEVTKARSKVLADPNQYRADHWKAYDFSNIKD
tara:strand:+ start:3028 stop:3459 length:432 start_codon:yes stop_codon:yes gene_type:complete